MLDHILAEPGPQPVPLHYLVPHPSTWKNYTSCPWAKSIIAIDPITEDIVLCPVTCKRWGCPYCAKQKIRKLAFLTNGAKPNRWIRLGVDPALYEGEDPSPDNAYQGKSAPQVAWEKTSNMLPEACRTIRKEVGECEYLRVTELHQSGFPHYHALLRSSYIPQRLLSNVWGKLTGAPVVWIAKIDSSFSSFRYLVKYLTKLHKIEWTDRHVSYSKSFFNPADREKIAFPEKQIEQKTDEHPWLYLSRRYDREMIGVDAAGCYHLPYRFCGMPDNLSRSDVGLPFLPEEAPTPEKTIVQKTAFETDDADDFSTQSF